MIRLYVLFYLTAQRRVNPYIKWHTQAEIEIFAVYKHDQAGIKQWRRCAVRTVHRDNTYDIEYAANFDGEVEVELKKPRRWIQKVSEQIKK